MTRDTEINLPPSLVYERHESDLAVLRLTRPEKRNAVDATMLQGMEQFFCQMPAGIRAVIITGAGDHFSAGGDLSLARDLNVASALSVSRACHRVFDRIEHGDVPVIAVLRGAVVGVALELAAAAHIRVAERGTFYALPEGSRGIFICGGGSVRVPRLIGFSRMMDMMLTGRTYSAEDGVQIGLSHYVVDSGEGIAQGIGIARRILANSSLANFAVMQALPRAARADAETGSLLESLMFSIAATDGEAKNRLRDFLEKKSRKIELP
jgi:enoyl-CoA hydratase/carnithine racemase